MEPVLVAAAISGMHWVLKTAGGAAVGEWSNRLISSAFLNVQRGMPGLQGLPENHDVARAIRIAQLRALDRLIRDYRDMPRRERDRLLELQPDTFCVKSLDYCSRGLARTTDSTTTFAISVTGSLTASIDTVFAVPEHGGPAHDRASTLGEQAENAVLEELRNAIGVTEFPDGFATHFRTGTDDERKRFLELFGAYISEELKNNERFRNIFTIGQLSKIEATAFETRSLLDRITDRFSGVLIRIETVITEVRSAQVVQTEQLAVHQQMLADIQAHVRAMPGVSAWQDGVRPSAAVGRASSPHEVSRSARPGGSAGALAESNIPHATPRHFVGREDEIREIEVALGRYVGRAAIIALLGMRGSGKSTLARVYAHRHRRDYRATWWLRAATETGICDDLVALGVRLEWVRPDEREDVPVATVLDQLQDEGEGILLVYDNAIDAEALKPYLPRGGFAHVLVTSNAQAWREVAEPIAIRLWPKSVGADFLLARTGTEGERDDAEKLSEALDGLPLAHEVAAAYCERLGIPLPEYRRRLDREGVQLIAKGASPREYHDHLSVTKAFQLAIGEAAKLHPAAEALILHAALLAAEPIPLFLFRDGRESFGQPLASLIADDGLDEAVAALRTFALVDREPIPDERNPATAPTDTIRLHRLVREIAAAQWESAPREAARRALITALATVYPPDDLYVLASWPRARRLDALGWALVGDDVALPRDSELSASDLMFKLGSYRHASTAAYAQARSLFDRALSIRESVLGADDPGVAQCLNSLGLLSWAQDDLASARSLCERALSIRERAYGPHHTDVAESLVNLARILREQRDLIQARSLCQRALSIYEAAFGSDHPDVALCSSTLVRVLITEGNFRSAEPLAEHALSVYEKALGPEHPAVAASLINVATVLQGLSRPGDAMPHLERALGIHERTLGSVHPTVASTLLRLASVCVDQRESTRALPLLTRALDINERTLGPDHPNSASVRRHLDGLMGQSA